MDSPRLGIFRNESKVQVRMICKFELDQSAISKRQVSEMGPASQSYCGLCALKSPVAYQRLAVSESHAAVLGTVRHSIGIERY
jgi:hypothetical protein